MTRKKPTAFIYCLLLLLTLQLLASCVPGQGHNLRNMGQGSLTAMPTFTPFQPLPAGIQPNNAQGTPLSPQNPANLPGEDTGQATDTAEPKLWIDPMLPPAFLAQIDYPAGASVSGMENANLQLTFGDERIVSHWTYVLCAPFSSLIDEIKLEALRQAWQGSPNGDFVNRDILLDESTKAAFSSLWGKPAGDSIRILASNALLDEAWRTQGFALLPFESLTPRWKVIRIDGATPLNNTFDETRYALRVPITLSGNEMTVRALLADMRARTYDAIIPAGNRDASKLTVLAMTGVTALVRATAHTMELQGITYPAEEIGDILRSADLTHISNEVPFASDCPYPNPVQSDVRFCSDARYIELLEHVGTDIVELTGDHFADWGSPAMYFTLELYDERGWQYYGGGYNLSEGKKPITIEHNGNRLAFIGCNGKGGQFATASDHRPGSVYCDYPYMQDHIQSLVSDGYLPIATFQHFEYYTYYAQPAQQRDFQALADAGAVIVSGSQAHQPQAFELRGNSFIHYGLGNLFFDQYLIGEPTRQGFIDLHVFYDGRYISTELVTIYFIDFAKPRLMNADERANLLNAVFNASGW